MCRMLCEHQMLGDTTADSSSLLMINSALKLLGVLLGKRIFNIRSMWVIMRNLWVLNGLRMKSCWGHYASTVCAWPSSICDFFPEFSRAAHFSAFKWHLDQWWGSSKASTTHLWMIQGIFCRTEILMMTCPWRSRDVWGLQTTTAFLWHIVFLVGRDAVAPTLTSHNRSWRSTRSVIRWVLLVITFKAERAQRSDVGDPLLLIREILR